MQIALVVHDLHQHGGHARYTFELARRFSKRHAVEVFSNVHDPGVPFDWASTHVPALRQTALSTVFSFPAGLLPFRRRLARFDIRHAQGFVGDDPNVVTAHICIEAFRASLVDSALRTRVSLAAMEMVEKSFYRRFDGQIIAISELVARNLKDSYGTRGRVDVVPHGVDIARFHSGVAREFRDSTRAELGLDEGKLVLLYVGDLAKAHHHLAQIARSLPDAVLLVLTGSRRYAWEASNVRILVTDKPIERYYAAADVFVFPSTYDAFGMVVLEAMACGLPVFCSDRAGAAELIEHGSTGYVLDLDAFTDDLGRHVEDLDFLKAMGKRAAAFAANRGWDPVADAVERIYRRVDA